MTLRDFVSTLFDYRIKHTETAWEEASQALARSGLWSLSGSPSKFEKIIVELCKRVEKLEDIYAERSTSKEPHTL